MKKLTVALFIAAALAPSLAAAHEAGDVIVRAGTATVRPTSGSDSVLGLGSFEVNNNTQMGLTFGYMVTDNIGVELLAATPFSHKIRLKDGAGSSLGTLATVKHLPPTLMAQYYFGEKQDKLRPYMGVGVNYTNFFSEKFNDTGSSAGLSDLSLDASWGVAGQVGLDYLVTDRWLLNMSVWWMNIKTDVNFKAGGESVKPIDTRIDPWVFMFGAGYRF